MKEFGRVLATSRKSACIMVRSSKHKILKNCAKHELLKSPCNAVNIDQFSQTKIQFVANYVLNKNK